MSEGFPKIVGFERCEWVGGAEADRNETVAAYLKTHLSEVHFAGCSEIVYAAKPEKDGCLGFWSDNGRGCARIVIQCSDQCECWRECVNGMNDANKGIEFWRTLLHEVGHNVYKVRCEKYLDGFWRTLHGVCYAAEGAAGFVNGEVATRDFSEDFAESFAYYLAATDEDEARSYFKPGLAQVKVDFLKELTQGDAGHLSYCVEELRRAGCFTTLSKKIQEDWRSKMRSSSASLRTLQRLDDSAFTDMKFYSTGKSAAGHEDGKREDDNDERR